MVPDVWVVMCIVLVLTRACDAGGWGCSRLEECPRPHHR